MRDIVLHFDTVKRYSNKSMTEYCMIPTLTCKEFNMYREGWGLLLTNMVADMLSDPRKVVQERQLAVFRGGTLCFVKVPLKDWRTVGSVKAELKSRERRNDG